MDDEIDIEEHDILEHPQVKALFPDLSKIQLQVHTSGDTFLDEPYGDLQDTDSDIEDVQELETASSLNEGNFEEDVLEEKTVGKDLETVDLTDSEGIGTHALDVNSDVIDELKASSDNVHDLDAVDEFIDEDQYLAAKKLIDEVQDIPTSNENVKECDTNGHIPEIPDENEWRKNEAIIDRNELAENIDEVKNEQGDDSVHGSESDVDGINGDENIENEFERVNQGEHETDHDEDFQPVRIKEEIVFESENSSDYEEILPDRFRDEPEKNIFQFSNKIILGSKPNPKVHASNVKYLVVLLEDWSVHLSQSQCYCDDCQTLFTTPNALDFHRMSAHSLLAPITNRAFKSTAKSAILPKNVSKKSTANKISNSTYCNHCNVSFIDHTSLIKHLYELLPVNKYNCKVCDAAFQSQTDLINHSTIHIKLEVPRNILKPRKTSENSILRKILNTEMKPMTSKATKRHYPVEEKVAKKVKQIEVKSEPGEFKYLCTICKEEFDAYGLARRHRTLHPQMKAYAMIKKIPIKKTKSKVKITFEKEKLGKAADKRFDFIQSTALFQCGKCGVHFSSSIAAKSHFSARQCGIHNNIMSCSICKKKLRRNDIIYHKKQHELSNKIKIYKITKTTYERTLCRCLRCNVHFEYLHLRMHIDQCGKIVSTKCKECNIHIPKKKYLEHSQKHDMMKLKRKDFIIIDYTIPKDKTKTKAIAKTKNDIANFSSHSTLLGKQVEPAIKIEPGKPNILNKLKFEREKCNLFYCNHCKCFFSRTYPSTNHKTKKCMTRRGKSSICKSCGLRVYNKILSFHEKLHTKKKSTLNDFTFLDYVTRKPIIPPIPQYPACEKCQIHFLSNAMKVTHICGEDYENCEVCGEKFEIATLKVHLPLHKLGKPSKPSRQPILPELMMKYESLNAIWNILFLCCRCDLVTDLYDTAVEHSQAHLSKLPQPNTIKCYICNLKFDENCWKKHSELHSRMPINTKHFRILKYSPEELLDESWFRMFASLPEKETRQILDRSVFGAERSLKMVLTKNGLPEFTIYCCSECGVCCDNESILQHANSDCKFSDQICAKCDIAFDSNESLKNHEQLHGKGIKKDEFRIVSFIKKYKSKTKNVKQIYAKMKSEKAPKAQNTKAAKYTVYKCVECTVCVTLEYSRRYHSCSPEQYVVYCKICKLNFSSRQNATHQAKHKKRRDFVAKNIRIEEFEPIPEGEDKPRRLAKKPQKTTDKRKGSKQNPKVIQPKPKVPDQRKEPTTSTKRRSSVESFESLVNLVTHSKTRKSTRISGGDEERTAKLYKCECGLHFTNLRSAQKHMESCDNTKEISKENCSKCGLLFPTDLLVAHLCKHHSRATQLCVEQLRKPETETKKNAHASGTIKLYKCGECNVYFLNQNSCYKHISRHEPLDSKQYIECKICRLQFRILSLHIHMKRHHEKEFLLEKVLVEEYQPRVSNEPPKIDIYFANERFENVQVSSSND